MRGAAARADCHCRRLCHPAGAATGSAGAQTATAGGCVTQRELLHAALARRLPLAGGLSAECLSTCPWPVAGICSWPAPAVANHTACATGKGDCAQRAPSILALTPMLQCMLVAAQCIRSCCCCCGRSVARNCAQHTPSQVRASAGVFLWRCSVARSCAQHAAGTSNNRVCVLVI